MENSGIQVDAGPPDQIHQDYQYDFDPNVELEEEGLDFGLDSSYEQVEHVLAKDVPEDAAVSQHGDEQDDGDYEADDTAAADEHVNATGAAEVADSEVPEYRDEIGYEDDELVTADVNADESVAEAEVTEVEQSEQPSEPQSVPADTEGKGEGTEAVANELDVSWNQDVDLTGRDENQEPQVESAGVEQKETIEDLEGGDLTADTFDHEGHEQSGTGHLEEDLDEVLEDYPDSSSGFPDIEVVYNEESYSLFGTSDDDPESYFLSDANELDSPLSQFLSALRAVISDELAPTDELVLRFDPLELEFGERSSEKFLNRSFREILDCHAALGGLPGTSTEPVIQLTVRRDSEEHFLELLARAEFVKSAPSDSEDSEMTDNVDEESPLGVAGDEQTHEQSVDRDGSEEYQDDAERAVSSQPVDHQEEAEREESYSHDDAAVQQPQDGHVSPSAPESYDVPEVSTAVEELPETVVSEDVSADHMVGEQDWEEPEPEGDAAALLQADVSGDISVEQIVEAHEEQEVVEHVLEDKAVEGDASHSHHDETRLEESREQIEPTEQQEGGAVETADSGLDDRVTQQGELEQDAGTNDDDLILAFDEDPSAPAVHEEVNEYEEYTITYDGPEIHAEENEGEYQPDDAETGDLDSKHSEDGGQVVAAAETASVHTSTTMNGDEIDYDEEDAPDDSLTPADDVAHQSVAAPGVDDDEIGWENDEDGDEYEEQPAGDDAGIDHEKSNDAAMSPPSVAGKRSRTDEAESLAGETDHKRRRT